MSSLSWIWPSWPSWGTKKPVKAVKATDAIRNPALNTRFTDLLDHTDPPATFKASEVAQSLKLQELRTMGYEQWTEAMPAVLALAFELRAVGYCEILIGKNVLPDDMMAMEIQEDVKIRRIDD